MRESSKDFKCHKGPLTARKHINPKASKKKPLTQKRVFTDKEIAKLMIQVAGPGST